MLKPLKVPSLARFVPKPLKGPGLGRSVQKALRVRSVPKPLKVPSLARSVPSGLGCGRQDVVTKKILQKIISSKN